MGMGNSVDALRRAIDSGFQREAEYLGCGKRVNELVPVVSVCVSTYQHGPYIRECLDSILAQEVSGPIEIIVGEDGSSDATRDICVEYARRRPDVIRLFLRDRGTSQYPAGLGTQRHMNLHWVHMSARAPYIALCEGDDYWIDPDKIELQRQHLDAHPELVMHGHRALIVDVHGNRMREWPNPQREVLKARDVISRGGGICATNSLMFRTSLLKNPPDWYYLFPVSDTALATLAVVHGGIGFDNRILAAYRSDVPGSWTQSHAALSSQRLLWRRFSYCFALCARGAPAYRAAFLWQAVRYGFKFVKASFRLAIARRS